MPVAVEKPFTSTQRPLPLRRRPDLEICEQTYRNSTYWLVKDPVSLKYFRLEREELGILEMLDGQTSLDELQHRFARRFPPQQITLRELHRLLGMFWRSSLVISETSGQGEALLHRWNRRRSEERWAWWSNPLAIRFRGFDPDALLAQLARFVGWFFSPWAVGIQLVAMLVAGLLVVIRLDEVLRRLPAFQEFFAVSNWLLLAVVLSATKILHEFGHGIACKRLGGECHEMGAMVLVFTPCLYCDVTDSWMLPNKWHRLAIGAAGMYVELCLATAATFLWLASAPGGLQDLCLAVMVTCSFSTLLFNANPLMRYDGYYMLSDLVEVPNLRQKASDTVRRWLRRWLLGMPAEPETDGGSQPVWLSIYAIASRIYAWSLTVAIAWFLYRILEPYGGKLLGQILVVGLVGGTLLAGVRQWISFFKVPGRWDRMNKWRVSAVCGVFGLVAAAGLFVPLPYRIDCPFQVFPRDAATVYVDVPGELTSILTHLEDNVQARQPLIQLKNSELEQTIVDLESQRDRLRAQLQHFQQRASASEPIEGDIKATEQAIAGLEERLAQRREQLDRLTVRSPIAGQVLPTPRKPATRPAGRLPSWNGSPLEPRNRSAYLTEATVVCRVGDPGKLEAMLAIDQRVADDVRPGQVVELMLEQLPGYRIRGTIDHVAKVDMEVAPDAMSLKAGGDVATRTDSEGHERLTAARYQANVLFDAPPNGFVFLDSRGRAKVHAGYRPLSRRAWIWFCHTFQFEL